MIVVVRIGVDNSVNAKALIEQLEPVQGSEIADLFPFANIKRSRIQQLINRMNLHHIDQWKGS